MATMTVEVSNLSRSATEKDIKILLKAYGKVDQLIFKNTGGIFNGKVIVTYQDRESGSRLMKELNGVVADGMMLRVRELANEISIIGLSQKRKGMQVLHQDITAGLYSEKS